MDYVLTTLLSSVSTQYLVAWKWKHVSKANYMVHILLILLDNLAGCDGTCLQSYPFANGGNILSLRPTYATLWVLGQSGL